MTDRLEEIVEVLRGRILRGMEAGTLTAGDRLPSGRKVAVEFGVDHRVILAAFRALSDEKLIETRARGGVYVAARRSAGAIPPVSASWLAEILAEGLAREVPAPDLPEWLRRCTETLRLRAAVIAATEDQLHGLCRELRDGFGLEADGIRESEIPETVDGPVALPLRRADILITTAAHADRVGTLGRALGKPVQVITVRPDLVVGEWAMLLREPVYAVVATAEFGEMIRQFFSGVNGIENLHIVVIGRDDVSTIPRDAPTYVTQSVRASLGAVSIPGRILPPARTISTESARAIFGFIIDSNIAALSRRTS